MADVYTCKSFVRFYPRRSLSVSQQGVKVICNTVIQIPEAPDLGEAGEVWVQVERPATCDEVSCPAHVAARRLVQGAFDLPLPPSHAATTRLLLHVEGGERPIRGVEILFNIPFLGVLGIKS